MLEYTKAIEELFGGPRYRFPCLGLKHFMLEGL